VKLARFLATLGPIGSLPGPKATWASAVVVGIGWFLPVPPLWLALVLLMLGTSIAVWASGEAEKEMGHDAHGIVADEVIGQSIALLLVPHSWLAFAAAFVLFRIFDVIKPFGAHRAQSLPGGQGIVADDFLAGIYSVVTLHGLLWVAARTGFTLP
jgi:phosphatidylglycerophosphatase A